MQHIQTGNQSERIQAYTLPKRNKRIKALVVLVFVNEAAFKITKAGLTASIYNLYAKAYLALLLKSIVMDDLLLQMGDLTAFAVLEALAVPIAE